MSDQFPKQNPRTPAKIGDLTIEVHRLNRLDESDPPQPIIVYQFGYRAQVLGESGQQIDSLVGDLAPILSDTFRQALQGRIDRIHQKMEKEAIRGEPDPLEGGVSR